MATATPARRPSRPASAPVVAVRTGLRLDADVEIVVPVHNGEAGLEAAVRRLVAYLEERVPLPWLVTIADNASADRTWGIACRLTGELERVRAVHLDHEGRGLALRIAWSSSTAPVVASMDLDLSTDLDALVPLVTPLLSGHGHVGIGTRPAPHAAVVRGPRRGLISRSYDLIVRTGLRSAVRGVPCGVMAVRTDVAQALLPIVVDDGLFFDTELLLLAAHNGLGIDEVPVAGVGDADSRGEVEGIATDDLRSLWRVVLTIACGEADLDAGRRDPNAGTRFVRLRRRVFRVTDRSVSGARST